MHPHMSPSPSRLRPTSRVRHTRPHVTRHTHTTRSGASPYMNAHLSIEFRPTTPKPASINKKKKRKPPLPATEEEGVPSPWLRCASLLSACVQSTQRRGRSHHHDHDPMAFMRSRVSTEYPAPSSRRSDHALWCRSVWELGRFARDPGALLRRVLPGLDLLGRV